MPFQKGQSGNPAGRPRGSRNRVSVLRDLVDGLEERLQKLEQLAAEGRQAARTATGSAATHS